MDMVGGEEREGEMYGESNMETYNTICKIDERKREMRMSLACVRHRQRLQSEGPWGEQREAAL